MIKPVFDKSIITESHLEFKVPYDSIPWIEDSLGKFYCNYYEDETININLSIEDIGDSILIDIYESTPYVNIMGLEDTKNYLQKMVLTKLENDFLIFQELLHKTKSFKDTSEVKDYRNIDELGYLNIYPGEHLKVGKSTLIAKFYPEFKINYRVWKTETGWKEYILEIQEESDQEFVNMKKHIVKKYYKNHYRYGRTFN